MLTTLPIESDDFGLPDASGFAFNNSILTDFEVAPSQKVRDDIYHFSLTNQRYLNFKGFGELEEMNLSVFYEYNNNVLVPLMIPPGKEVYVKLQFRRKKNKSLKEYNDNETKLKR